MPRHGRVRRPSRSKRKKDGAKLQSELDRGVTVVRARRRKARVPLAERIKEAT